MRSEHDVRWLWPGLILVCILAIPVGQAWSQDEVAVYEEDFDAGPGGWFPLDMTGDGIYWHHDVWYDFHVAWCGARKPCWPSPNGYGNSWHQNLTKSFSLPAGAVSLDFDVHYDLEPTYDFLIVQLSADGGATWTDLDTGWDKLDWWWNGTEMVYDWYGTVFPDRKGWIHGRSDGFEHFTVDLAAWAGQDVALRFRVVTDPSYSDEDGLFITQGACRLDWVAVGAARDDFDLDLDGWVASEDLVGGGPYRLQAGLAGNATPAWTAYDLDGPHAGEFPWTPLEFQAANRWVNLGIESPEIPIPPDAEDVFLEFGYYRGLYLENWVFHYFEVTSGPGCGDFVSDAHVYYAPGDPADWGPFRINLKNCVTHYENDLPVYGSLIPDGREWIKIRLCAVEIPWPLGVPFSGHHPQAPFFDDVRILVPGGEGTLAGTVSADCPAAGSPLHGVKLVVYDGTGAEAATLVTDAAGGYATVLQSGDYTVSLVTPLGYGSVPDEYAVTVLPGLTTDRDFALNCLEIASNPRSVGYWKHQVSEATGGVGQGNLHRIKVGKNKHGDEEPPADVDSPVCDYLDLIEDHFNDNLVNEVAIYDPPAEETCLAKLEVAKALLNLTGSQEMVARARQQLMALLLNVAAGNIHLTAVISEDGATVTQAVTWCDNQIDLADGAHEAAKTVADLINNGLTVPAGMIPLDTAQIAYRQGVTAAVRLLQNQPNPFNPSTTIRFEMATAGTYGLSIYDGAGRLVRSLDGFGRGGLNEVVWQGDDETGRQLGSGVYFCALEANGERQTLKMVMLQ